MRIIKKNKFSQEFLRVFPYFSAFTLMEVAIAVALFSLMATGIVPVTLRIFDTVLQDQNQLQAHYYVQQGLEALRSIRDYNYSNLSNGTYGLSRIRGYWELGSPETIGQFTRTISISDTLRDSSCALNSHGTIDTTSKQVTVTVSWQSIPGVVSQQTETQNLTNWRNNGSCEQAGNFVLNLTGAVLNGAGKRMEGITIQNIGSTPITIDKITPSWTNGGRIQEVKIESTIVWKNVGVGSPTGDQSSGTQLDIDNIVVPANSGWVSLDHFFFDSDMTGTTLTMYFTMADGSVKYESKQF